MVNGMIQFSTTKGIINVFPFFNKHSFSCHSFINVFVYYKIIYYSEELVIEKPDSSELAPLDIQHSVERESGKYFVKLQPTDINKDFSQTTVPYFDIQSVVINPPAQINGIGIYYKASQGFGGFIALKLITPDYSQMKFNKKAIEKTFNNIDDIIESQLNISVMNNDSSIA